MASSPRNIGNRESSAVDSPRWYQLDITSRYYGFAQVQVTHNRRHPDIHGLSLTPTRNCAGHRLLTQDRGRLNQRLREVPQLGVVFEPEQTAIRTGCLCGTASFNRESVRDPPRSGVDKPLQFAPQHFWSRDINSSGAC